MTYVGKNNMLTTSGVAKMLHIHINTVRRWSNQGILKPYRLGPRGDRRFKRDDILFYLSKQQYVEPGDYTSSSTTPSGN